MRRPGWVSGRDRAGPAGVLPEFGRGSGGFRRPCRV